MTTHNTANMRHAHYVTLIVALLGTSACDADIMQPRNATAARVTITASNTAALESFGDSVVLLPKVLDQHGKALNGVRLRWSVEPAGIVERDAEGVYRATGNGRAVIIAAIDPGESGVRPGGYWAAPIADSVVVEVQQRAARLTLGPVDTAFVTLNAQRRISVEVTDARGNALQTDLPALSWHSADAGVATVSDAGVVRSTGPGAARISVEGDQLSGSAIFTVSPYLPHTSCMVYMQRRQTLEACVTLDFIVREAEAGR